MSCKKTAMLRAVSIGVLGLMLTGAFIPQVVHADDSASDGASLASAADGEPILSASDGQLNKDDVQPSLDTESGDDPDALSAGQKSILDYAAENKGTLVDGSRIVLSPCNAPLKVLDVSDGSRSNGGNVQLYASNMTQAQLWDVSEDQDGFLTFKNVGSGLVLDLAAGKAASSQNVQQYASNGTRAQKWIAVKGDDGSVTIHSAVDFDYVLDVSGGSSNNGANIQVYGANGTAAQSFMTYDACPEVAASGQTVDDGVYSLSSDGLALDIAGASDQAGATVQRYAANGSVAQAFRFTYDNESGFYTIASMVSGRLLDAEYGSVVPNGAVHQYGSLDDPSSITRNRLWAVTLSGDQLVIRNAANGYYLSASGSKVFTAVDPLAWSRVESPQYTWTSADVDRFAALHAGDIADGQYALCMTKASHSVLDVAGGSVSSGANVQIYGSNNTAAQRWNVANLLDASGNPTGYVTVSSVKSNLVLDAAGGSKASGTNVQQYASNGTAAQKWIAVKQGDGSFVFYSGLGRRLVVDVSGGSTQNGSNVQLWLDNGSAAQRFVAVDALPSVGAGENTVADGMYQISSAQDESYCFDISGGSTANGAVVQTYRSNGTLAQGFKLTFNASTGFYSIQNVKTAKGLDLDSGDILPGAKVQMWDYPGVGKNQQWRIELLQDGNYVIRSAASNLVLTRLSNGRLTTAIADGSLAQEWKFTPYTYSIAEGCYSIYSGAANKYVDVSGGSYSESAALQVYAGNGTMAQKWWARKLSDGTYTFQCVNSAKYLSSRISDGGMVQIGDSADESAHWILDVVFGKGIALKNVKSGKYLSLSGNSGSIYALDLNGSNGQAWVFTSTPVVPEGFYELAPMHALGSRLDISAGSKSNGANAQIYSSNGTLSQRYWLRGVGSGWYSLTSCCSAFPLDVLNCGTADGTNVQQWQWNGSIAQRWRFEMGVRGIKIVSACGDKVLDVSGANTGNGANVQLWSYNGSAAQGWRFIVADRPAKIGYQNPSQYPQVSSLTVRLPSYCTGEFTYVTPSRIAIDATRDDCVNAFIQRAYEYIGTQYIEPYSTAPGGAVDCSGFVLQCLYATGMDMGIYNPYNHRWLAWQTYNSMNWYNNGTFMPVSVNAMQRGDVIYYRGHIAIYLGNGRMIDSWPRQGVGIHGVYERGNPIGAARPFV